MIKKCLPGLIFTATTVFTGPFWQINSASADPFSFRWNNSWQQPQILPRETTGFDDTFFQQYVQAERVALPNSQQLELDPSKLFLKYSHNVSVYFINEGAKYRNQLAYTATGATNRSGLVFNDISCRGRGCVGDWGGGALRLGDGVNLGNFAAGTKLDFWLRADGWRLGDSANIYGSQASFNPDGLQHMVAYAVRDYILIGFEDLYGPLGARGIDPRTGRTNENSDRDFNDVVFVVDVGADNVRALASVPEPTTTLSVLGVGILGMLKWRRRQNKAEKLL